MSEEKTSKKRKIFKTLTDIKKAERCQGLRLWALEDFKQNHPEAYEEVIKQKK